MLRSLLKNNPILALLALGVAAGGIFLWQRGDFSFTAQKESQEQISDTQLTETKEASNETDTVQAVERRSTIDDILVDIEPLLAGGKKGDVQRFWFAQNEGVYVEYETREGMRMAYLAAQNNTWQRGALYGASETGWEVMEGEDVLFSHPQQRSEEHTS